MQAREGVGLMETGNEGEKDSATPERLSVFARVLGEYSTVHVNLKVVFCPVLDGLICLGTGVSNPELFKRIRILGFVR